MSRFKAARYGPDTGDALAVLVNAETHEVVQQWVSSSIHFAKYDIVRGTEVPWDEVDWIPSDELNALMESHYARPRYEGERP